MNSIISSQTATQIVNLQTPDLDETSGLLFYDGKIITHNDSGNANLYEVDSETGFITRTVEILNTTIYDLEDITQDNNYIYIGDIGNNYGNRTNLKVYKISKADYNDSDNKVTPEVIYFSYEDQVNFTASLNNNNWDAEALISYGENLLIFTKNWVDKKTNVYSIPKNAGIYSANLESSYNTNGLVTGADTSSDDDIIYLSGYSSSEAPFMFTIHNIPNNSLNIFSGSVSEKITNIAPLGNQIEAITLFEITPTKHRLYISNEKFTTFLGSIPIVFPAKLWIIEVDVETFTLGYLDNISQNEKIKVSPNPFYNTLNLSKKVDEAIVYDLSGKVITKQILTKKLSLQNLNKGIYILKTKTGNSVIIEKIFKL